MIDEALELAELGLPIFPLTPGSKVPLKGSNGVKDCSTDPVQIQRWWAAMPNANIGLATGSPSGLVVIDVDVKNGAKGIETAANLVDENGERFKLLGEVGDPGIMWQITPSGGFHAFFSYPRGVDIRNSVLKIGSGIDVRGTGGYVCVAPSVTPEGSYKWIHFPDLPRELPKFLVNMLREPVFQTDELPKRSIVPNGKEVDPRVIEDRLRAIEAAPQGTRNDTLNRQAFYLFTRDMGGISRTDLATRLMGAAIAAGLQPPEAARTIGSALEAGLR